MTTRTPSTHRDSRIPPKVPEVESLPCPTGGLHVLACDRWGRVRCGGCGETWATLDGAVRAS